MKTISLTQGLFAIVDDEDFESLNRWKWYAKQSSHKNSHNRTFYAVRSDRSSGRLKRIWMHREIMRAKEDLRVDHRNRNGLDNQKKNLRTCSHQQNMFNSTASSRNKIGIKGVCWNIRQRKFEAYIKTNGKQKHLGYFDSVHDAAFSRDIAAQRLHGEYARTSFT